MIRISNVVSNLSTTIEELQTVVAKKIRISSNQITNFQIAKRSIDARHGNVNFIYSFELSLQCDEKKVVKNCNSKNVAFFERKPYVFPVAHNNTQKRPVVVGSGPAGLFAALVLAESGLKPIVLERGKDIDKRNEDVKLFNLTGKLNCESNIQFGEGGAGTFSDGKLNTGIQNERCRFVLETFAKYGNAEDILWQARPHAGTDRLYLMIKNLRQYLQSLGTEFCFETKVIDCKIENNRIKGLIIEKNGKADFLDSDEVILAIGHSARDTFHMLFDKGVYMEQKPFAVGVRIEHKREMINKALYGSFSDNKALGSADYRLAVHPDNGRGVYTFCMCPGGVVVPASSEENMVCVNGMSLFSRNDDNSNSAVLTGVKKEDFPSDHPLAGFELQRQMEKNSYQIGGGDYVAPVQLVGDFLRDKASTKLGEVKPSYARGVNPTDLSMCLPKFVVESLKEGIPLMGNRIKGFDMYDAVLTGVESRTSSPVRIIRDETGQSNIVGLYPSGEGAGYAGGIVSSAVDGMIEAEHLIQNMH